MTCCCRRIGNMAGDIIIAAAAGQGCVSCEGFLSWRGDWIPAFAGMTMEWADF